LEVPCIRPAFQIEKDLGTILREFTRSDYDPIFVRNWELKVTRARLEFVEYSDKALMVPVCLCIVLYEVQVRPVRQGTHTGVPVRPRQVQIEPSLTIIHLGPVAGYACDVVRLNDFLDLVYD